MSADADPRLSIGGNNPPEQTLVERLTDAYGPIAKEIDAVADKANALPKKVTDDATLALFGPVVKEARSIAGRVEDARKNEKAPIIKAGRDVDGFFAVFTDRLKRIAAALEERATDYVNAKRAEERRKAEEAARAAREKAEEERRKAEAAEAAGRANTAAKAEGRAEAAEAQARRFEEKADGSNSDLVRTRGADGTLATARTKTDIRIVDFAKADLEKLRPYLDREAVLKAARAWLRVTKGTETLAGFEVFDDVKASFR